MSARPNLSSIPASGITVDGIVDVLGGKGIVVAREVSATNDAALKGQLLEVDGAGKVKTASENCAKLAFAGVAVSSAVKGSKISTYRFGIARAVIAAGTIAIGDQIASFGDGKVVKLAANGKSGVATTVAIGEVSDVGAGYVDFEVNLIGAAV